MADVDRHMRMCDQPLLFVARERCFSFSRQLLMCIIDGRARSQQMRADKSLTNTEKSHRICAQQEIVLGARAHPEIVRMMMSKHTHPREECTDFECKTVSRATDA